MNLRLLLILISAIVFYSCDGVKYLCVKPISSVKDTCYYRGVTLTNLDTVSISRFVTRSKKKYIITVRPSINDFNPNSMSVIRNNNPINIKKIQKESLNGRPYYIFSPFSFLERDTIIFNIKKVNVNVLDTFILMNEKLFFE